ncbi:MAG: hypothetical protein LIP01_07445, partial [Tannerellaceae bacterium]|nr:hypothetical protein [Tannerellaceae bacterium]
DISYFPDISSEFSYTFIEDKEEKYDSFIPLEIIVFERFYEDTVTYKSKKAGLNLNVRPINAVDTSVMHVIYCRGGEVEQNENLKKIIDQNFTAEFPYPIPFIEDITVNASAVNALDSTYMVYVYQAEGKRAVPEKYHMNPAVGILPGEWPHGYSTGVNVSDSRNEIIYWAVAW